jgi:hypothetical protein
MIDKDGNIMSLEEAVSMLEEVYKTLAQNAVHNKRLIELADNLERYIALKREELAKEKNTQEEAKEEDEHQAE